jgi:signal transduction histidine kinase
MLTSMVGIAAVAIVLFALPLGIAVRSLYKNHEVIKLEREATRAVVALPAKGLDRNRITVPIASRGVSLGYYDGHGRLIAGSGPRAGGPDVAGALAGRVTESGGRTLVIAVPIPDEATVVGAARAAESASRVDDRTYTTWAAMFGLGCLALIVAALLGRRQARRLEVPINDIETIAVRLGDGDFTARVDPDHAPELARAANALNQTAIRLGDLMARERSFTADVSHQLATPLTSLRLGLESALMTPGIDQQGAIEDAVAEVERLQGTVTTLLALARDTPTEEPECDVERVCVDVAERHRVSLAGASRALVLDIDPALPAAGCSADALREIVEVLVDNAERHGNGTVHLRGRRAGRGIVVEIEDEGSGITGDTGRIFERKSSRANGRGIGLGLARALADAHGARLRLTRAAPHPVFAIALVTSRSDHAGEPD